jgi:O-antigen/teichoic acid export membrane protein
MFGLSPSRRYIAKVFADQALISGASFVSGIILARSLGLQGYGLYVLLYAVLLYANTVTNSLVTMPMMTLAPLITPASDRARLLRGAMLLQFVLSLFLAIACCTLVVVAGWFRSSWHAGDAVWAMGPGIVAFQMQDWLRRHAFVERAVGRALLIDALAYLGQIALMLAFASRGALTPASAWWCLFAPFAVAFGVGWFGAALRPSWADAQFTVRAMWRTSRDYFASTQLQWAGSQGVLFIGASSFGLAAAGALRAAQNIVGPSNIFFQVLENLVPVHSAMLYRERGRAAAKAYVKRVLWASALPLGAFFLAVSLAGGWLMHVAYGPEYEVYSRLIAWMSLYMMVQLGGRVMGYWRRTTGESGRLTRASFAAAVVSVVAVFVLSPLWGVDGFTAALVLGALSSFVTLALKARSNPP